jgi:hypothetical protein
LDDLFFLHLRCIQPDAGALLPLCRGHGVLVFVSLFRWTLPLWESEKGPLASVNQHAGSGINCVLELPQDDETYTLGTH